MGKLYIKLRIIFMILISLSIMYGCTREFGKPFDPIASDIQIDSTKINYIGMDSVNITIFTSVDCKIIFYYGKTTQYTQVKQSNQDSRVHILGIGGLIPETTYHYYIKAYIDNKEINTNDATFTTLPPDTTPPIISNLVISDITINSAKVTWTTDDPSMSSVYYVKSSSSDTLVISNNYYNTTHVFNLTNLSENTEYKVYVKSTNRNNLTSKSETKTFTTLNSSFTITDITASGITCNSAVISWKTNKPSTSILKYGETTQYGTTIVDTNKVTTHKIILNNLSNMTTYNFKVGGKPFNEENIIYSENRTFTTKDYPYLDLSTPSINIPYADTLNTYTFDINLKNGYNIALLSFRIIYDSNLIKITDIIKNEEYTPSTANPSTFLINSGVLSNGRKYYEINITWRINYNGSEALGTDLNGDLVNKLVTIKFKKNGVVGGNTIIDLSNEIFWNIYGQNIQHNNSTDCLINLGSSGKIKKER